MSHATILSKRRTFLKGLAAAGALTFTGTAAGSALRRPMRAWAAAGNDNTVLVSVFLRGAADGLSIVCPHGDDDYYRQRGAYALPASDYDDLDGFFGLNKGFSALTPAFRDGRVSFVQAVGSHDATRSHFLAMPNMDTAFGTSGWLNRVIAASSFASNEAGLSIGGRTSPPLVGPWSGRVVDTIDGTVNQGLNLEAIRPAIQEMYGSITSPTLERGAVMNALDTIDDLAALDPMPGEFPNTALGRDLREAASLIRADIGVRAIAVDSGGWDHHTDGLNRMLGSANQLAPALAAFLDDLGSAASRVMVVVSSEFGRNVIPNGSDGTDHGHGNMMMVLGDPLTGMGGGKVLTPGGWPGLATPQLSVGRDLAITTDFRSVYAELVAHHLRVVDDGTIFPNFVREHVGLLYAPGDVNGSGVIESGDVQTLLDGNVRDGSNQAGDLDGDGDTDLRDALLLAKEVGTP